MPKHRGIFWNKHACATVAAP